MILTVSTLLLVHFVGLTQAENSTGFAWFLAPETLISGGVYAKKNDFPYQVSVQYERIHVCGGSIIHLKYVLSSAGCVLDYTNREIEILAGTNMVDKGGIRISVVSRFFIGKYRKPCIDDIVVLKLRRWLPKNNPGIRTIALPTSDSPDGTSCIVSGWGAAKSGQYTQTKLKALYTTTIPNRNCQNYFTMDVPILDGNVCTLTRVGEGICDGDRGDPLVDTSSYVNDKPVQIGIASHYVSCAKGVPDIYTRLYPYVPSIRQILK